MNKLIKRYYNDFQALAFSTTDRNSWPVTIKIYWIYLLVVIWFHQGIAHNNWENIFGNK